MKKLSLVLLLLLISGNAVAKESEDGCKNLKAEECNKSVQSVIKKAGDFTEEWKNNKSNPSTN